MTMQISRPISRYIIQVYHLNVGLPVQLLLTTSTAVLFCCDSPIKRLLSRHTAISFLEKSLTCKICNESVLKRHVNLYSLISQCLHTFLYQVGSPQVSVSWGCFFIVFPPLPCHYDLCVTSHNDREGEGRR